MRTWEPFDRFEFADRLGRVREVSGCSLLGLFEFQDRVKELWQIIGDSPDSETWITLYEWDKRFKFVIDRCLELNGIDPDWVTPSQVQQLLFERADDQPGWLIEINMQAQESTRTQKEATPGQAIAAIASHTKDISLAQQLADQVPARDLEAILTELNELAKAQADPEKSKKKRNQQKAREGLEKLIKSGKMPQLERVTP